MSAAPPSLPDVRPFAEIARGPVASVFKAYDRATGETVLLKQLRPGAAADPERCARFADEARLAATVDHPNVVRVRCVADDGTALVADWIEGADLAAVLGTHGALPAALAAQVAREALAGLAAVHAAGILHRDVKAANVLLGTDGTVRLTDFGLASLVPEVDGDGSVPEVRGSLETLAPEIVQGGPPSAASDVFSLGAVLAHALLGRAPFAAGTPSATLDAVLHADVSATLGADPRVPDALADVTTALLARAPSSRPSAAEAAQRLDALGPASAEDLAAWLADPTTARSPPLATAPRLADSPAATPTRVRPARRLHLALAGVALLAAVALAVVVGRPESSSEAPPIAAAEAPTPVTLVPPPDSLGAPAPRAATETPSPAPGASPDAGAVLSPMADGPPPATSPVERPVERPERSRPEPLAGAPPGGETPRAPVGTGTLVVVAEPWAAVRVNGRAVGTTPVAPLTLPAGDHEVAFENPAFPGHTVTVTVTPGETARAAVSLWALVARVTLDVTPWAEVWVDGQRWDTVPPQARPLVLPPGPHTLTFVHPTLGRREVPLRVAAGEVRTVRVRLAEPPR